MTTTAPPARTRPRITYRTARTTRRLVRAQVALAAVGGALAGAAPSGLGPADLLVSAGWAALVTAAASRARRGPALWMAGVAALVASDTTLLLLAGGAVALAFASAWLPERERAMGAGVGLLAMQVLLRIDLDGFHGASALLAAVACIPVLVSGYRMARAREQRIARRAAIAAVVVAGLALLLFGLTVVRGRSQIDRGVDLGNQGLAALRAGDQERGAALLDRSAAAFDQAAATFTSPLGYPARAVPLLGHQARATTTMADAGASVADAAAEAATAAAYDDVEIDGGTVDLALVARMQDPLVRSQEALQSAERRLAGIDNPWLVAPLADPLDRFAGSVTETLPDIDVAVRATEVAPWLLGADGPRHYFVAFATPAEARGLGGFVGSYGLLTAEGGTIDLTLSGRINEISAPGGDERTLSGPEEYLARYGRYFPARNLQNVTASPDFPTVAGVLAELYPQTGGAELDGALYVDPIGLAALLRLTGPVDVPGRTTPLSADNAADFLLVDQYAAFPDESTRVDFLTEAADATFEALTSRPLPAPGRIIDVLGPPVRGGHLLFHAFDPDAGALLADQGIAGAFPTPEGGDLLSVRTANANPSKIDAYLHRDVDYEVRVDPGTGALEATVRVLLVNEAPTEGLPDDVIGNRPLREGRPGPPAGTNRTQLSIYTPHEVQAAAIDGEALPLGRQPELGVVTFNALVDVPPGGRREIVLELVGAVDPGAYHLVVAGQALSHPDDLTVEVHGTTGWEVAAVEGPGADHRQGRAVLEDTTTEDRSLTVTFVP